MGGLIYSALVKKVESEKERELKKSKNKNALIFLINRQRTKHNGQPSFISLQDRRYH